MKKIAILGFGVVGSGVAEVLTQNKALIKKSSMKKLKSNIYLI